MIGNNDATGLLLSAVAGVIAELGECNTTIHTAANWNFEERLSDRGTGRILVDSKDTNST